MFLVSSAIVTINAYEGDRVINDPTKAVTVSPHSLTIKRGQAYCITASPAAPFASSPIVWTSSDTSVAVVTQYGLVIGKSSGTATITATVNDIYVSGYE